VSDHKIKHSHYKKGLLIGLNQSEKQRTIRSFNHQVYSIQTDKCALSAVNDKRHMVDNQFGYSFGHYKISHL
jgi:hypothetical protein